MRWVAPLLCATLLCAACTQESHAVVAGLHSAGAQVFVTTPDGERTLAVGSKLHASDHLRATGPAVIEYFGGGIHFVERESLVVSDTPEAKVRGQNVPAWRLEGVKLVRLPPATQLVASRYADPSYTPATAFPHEPSQGEYLAAFFMPNGIEKMTSAPMPEGPREPLPPPPLRRHLPRLHAGALGEGGLTLEVQSGFVAAESRSLTTAILREDRRFDLGEANRLLVFPGARARLFRPDGQSVTLKGPLDVRL